jgi:hypothetical protein
VLGASRPSKGDQVTPTRSSDDFRDAPWSAKAIVLGLGLAFVAWGSFLFLVSFGETGFMAKSDLPRWIGHAAGLIFLLAGIAMCGLFLYGVGLRLSLFSGVVGLLLALASAALLVVVFHWGAFFTPADAWGGTWIGPLGPRDFARIIVVGFDILVLLLGAGALWMVPKVLRRETLPKPPDWAFVAFIFGPFVLALALHFAGAFDWVERTAPGRFPILARKAPPAAPKPEPARLGRPLEHYLGWWKNPQMDRETSHRIEVRSEGAAVFIQAWWHCAPKDCDRGEGRAQAIPLEPGSDHFVELRTEIRNYKGEVLTIALVPEGDALRLKESTRAGEKITRSSVTLRRGKW